MLDPQEEYTLAKRWREDGDRDAAHKLVTSYLRLVVKIAKSYRGYGLPMARSSSLSIASRARCRGLAMTP
jgi:RNA polymerase sigma-32 factor